MRSFGDLESVIMDRLWSWRRPATVRDLERDLRTERDIAYTTVMTVMDNLHRKGWLTRRQQGRAYLYEVTYTREQYAAHLMHEALTLSQDHNTAFTHFLGRMSQEESDALRRALGDYERDHDA
ncbi:BlaI/MecI/CopY family transcriptional regulator [Amycolatopsis nigrescens]|uniref:BlaI/MecI/CopY family transcriptional regulator n=1 Tax=Amycolatopsis nigrescens TaxID=381445 RepID=UPI0003728BDF|nr:BlaI/MecI/CopY family transcriptional regulator [Amycolatopsis nigrescens]